MEQYRIKYVDENGYVLDADPDPYFAENELDALHQFTEARRNDVIIQNIEIVKDDPKDYTLKIRGWYHDELNNVFDTYEGLFEYFAERENHENGSTEKI